MALDKLEPPLQVLRIPSFPHPSLAPWVNRELDMVAGKYLYSAQGQDKEVGVASATIRVAVFLVMVGHSILPTVPSLPCWVPPSMLHPDTQGNFKNRPSPCTHGTESLVGEADHTIRWMCSSGGYEGKQYGACNPDWGGRDRGLSF